MILPRRNYKLHWPTVTFPAASHLTWSQVVLHGLKTDDLTWSEVISPGLKTDDLTWSQVISPGLKTDDHTWSQVVLPSLKTDDHTWSPPVWISWLPSRQVTSGRGEPTATHVRLASPPGRTSMLSGGMEKCGGTLRTAHTLSQHTHTRCGVVCLSVCLNTHRTYRPTVGTLHTHIESTHTH